MHRRSLLISFGGWSALARSAVPTLATAAVPEPALHFPVDFGAHPGTNTEWWYLTGELSVDTHDTRVWGFQLTFFRAATGLAAASSASSASSSRFAPAQLLLAHAALTDITGARLRHDQRLARSGFGIAQARGDDTDVELRDWSLRRSDLPGGNSRYRARFGSERGDFALALDCDTTQPLLLQGEAGVSRKGPGPHDTSRYYSQPQLQTHGRLTLAGKPVTVQGRAWLDHEWSDGFIPDGAVGWDWIGMNLADGSALTAFRLRRADGSALYAGGSFRRVGQPAQNFASGSVRFTPERVWESAATRARYPVQWTIETPAGRWQVRALFDNQELDSRASTGAVYWEGLSELRDANGARVGRGYLEMTGYAAAMKL